MTVGLGFVVPQDATMSTSTNKTETEYWQVFDRNKTLVFDLTVIGQSIARVGLFRKGKTVASTLAQLILPTSWYPFGAGRILTYATRLKLEGESSG